MVSIITDPHFYAVAIPAVLLVGLGKGGLGGPLGLAGVPLMALAVPPVQAAAIFLPILIVMDAVSVWSWRGKANWPTLAAILPGGFIGVGIGWMTAAMVTANEVRLIVGAIALIFVAWMMFVHAAKKNAAQPESLVRGSVWGAVAGFTSFVAHAGGPPYQVYALRLGHSPVTYAATSVYFFAAVNVAKLVPYFALGQFDASNLATSAALAPLAPLATLAGVRLIHHIRREVFYPLMYVLVALVGAKLVYDGLIAL